QCDGHRAIIAVLARTRGNRHAGVMNRMPLGRSVSRLLRHGVWPLVVAVAATSCGGGGGGVRVQTTPSAQASAPRANQQMIGRWNLVGLEVQRDGQLVSRPASGELTYDE